MASSGGRGCPVGEGDGTHCLRITPLLDHLLQVLGESSVSRGRQLAGSGAQPLALQLEVGATNQGVEQGGNGCQDIGTDLLGGDAIVPDIQVRELGSDTAYT